MERVQPAALMPLRDMPFETIVENMVRSGMSIPVSLTFGPFFGILFPVSQRFYRQNTFNGFEKHQLSFKETRTRLLKGKTVTTD
jgi:hypothetical protein